MTDLAARIASCLGDSKCELWFPQIIEDLAMREWERLRKEVGIVPATYSTARVLGRSVSIPRTIVSTFESPSSLKTSNISVEAVQPKIADSYRKAGISFYSTDEIEKSSVLACVGDALKIIGQIPNLFHTVHNLVRSLHVIKPPDAEHDVSFSEPQIPFSIFISVLEERVSNDALRVAEAIVHEAMHLHLTIIENIAPLVSLNAGKYYSPWRQQYRNAESLLHGVYVFSVIARFLGELTLSDLRDCDYVSGRLEDISAELNQTEIFSQCSELTFVGSRLVNRLLPLRL